MKKIFFSLCLLIVLTGCTEYSQMRKAVEDSVFYKENLAAIKQYNSRGVLLATDELWIGEVKQHNENSLIFSNVDCIESYRRGLFRTKCSKKHFYLDSKTSPFFNAGEILLFVVRHDMKGGHSILVDRVAKVEKVDGGWQVIPLEKKTPRKVELR